MTQATLSIIVHSLGNLMSTHEGINNLVIHHKRFEGWIQVELVKLLIQYGCMDIKTEYAYMGRANYFDISFNHNGQNWAIEIKVLTTQYVNNHEPNHYVPGAIGGVIRDAIKLNEAAINNRALIFLAYPVTHDFVGWQNTLNQLNNNFIHTYQSEIVLVTDPPIRGVLYLYLNPEICPKHLKSHLFRDLNFRNRILNIKSNHREER